MKINFPILRDYLRAWLELPLRSRRLEQRLERLTFDLGCLQTRLAGAAAFPRECEHQVFSQAGDDGIIQYLTRQVPISHRVFVEFGVENYRESNTRFLLWKDYWAGLVLDGSQKNIDFIRRDPLFGRRSLQAECAFVTAANIDELLVEHLPTKNIGLLSIDIDGNDYWIWKAIQGVTPAIVITEYNHRFGPSRAVTVPYDEKFNRRQAHPSNIYYGASLKALWILAKEKGYDLVACNSYGNNAYWVRSDLRPATLRALTAEEAFCAGQFKEGKNARGDILTPAQEQEILNSLSLVEIPES